MILTCPQLLYHPETQDGACGGTRSTAPGGWQPVSQAIMGSGKLGSGSDRGCLLKEPGQVRDHPGVRKYMLSSNNVH